MASKSAVKNGGLSAVVVAIISATIAIEGGYVNNAADPGGETKNGITKNVAAAYGYIGPMRALPMEVTRSIYYDGYLVQPGYLPLVSIDAAVTEELFDTTVNMGAVRPGRFFQASINTICGTKLAVDGKVGAVTIATYRSCQSRTGAAELCVKMLDSLDAQQLAEYVRLVGANGKLQIFYRGWVAKRIGNVDRAKCKGLLV